jgi:hypothetical protein
VGRHRHVVNVRADGIAVVLGPLLSDARITAAALVDVDSGMVLDAWSAPGPGTGPAAPDLEMLGAQHAEVVRCALALLAAQPLPDDPEARTCEVVLGADGGPQHLLRTVPDPHGDRLALAVVVDGPRRVLDRVRKRLRSVSVDALTAGPSMTRRPVLGGWSFAMPGPDVPASGPPAPPAPPGASTPPVAWAPPRTPTPPVAAAPPGTSTPPSGASPPRGPALSGLDGAHLELPFPRDRRPHPEPAPPAPAAPEPAPSAPVRLDARSGPAPEPSVPHLRSVRPDPAARPDHAAAPRLRGPAPREPRPPSPPAALPAPPRPRSG